MRHWISINDNRDDNGYDCSSINLHTSVAQLPRDGEEEDHHEGTLSRGWGATIWRIRSVRVTRVTSLQKKGVERQIIGKGEGRGWVTVGLGLALSRKHDTERSTEFLEPLAIYGNSGANGALHDFPFVSFRFVDERSMALLSPPRMVKRRERVAGTRAPSLLLLPLFRESKNRVTIAQLLRPPLFFSFFSFLLTTLTIFLSSRIVRSN